MTKSAQAKRKEMFLRELSKQLGIITLTCEIVGITRKTYYDWCEKDPEFKKACMDIDDKVIDFVEHELFKQVKEGNIAAIIFYLKTKAKKRGYVEQIDWNIKPIEIQYILPEKIIDTTYELEQ